MLTPLDNSCYGISIMQNNDITSAIKNGVSFSSVCQCALDKLKLFLSALRLYNDRVPVLLHEGLELSQYFLDDAKVRDYLSKIG